MEKLRKFEIPVLTDRQKEILDRYIEIDKKVYHARRTLEEEFWKEDF